MANEARLKIVIDALNMAKGELGALEKDLGGVQGATQKAAQSNAGFKGTWTELSSAIGVAKQAYQAVDQVMQATVGETVAYAAQIRELSRTIGATAEQSSILIQAADDVGISAGTIQTAMEAAIRKGVRPTIEGMAELSEKYNSIQDPIEKTEFLMKNFGRAGSDLAPLMKLGADGIRDAGQAARDAGLVMSEEGVAAARAYEIAMDDLGDAVKGAQYRIGSGLIPVLLEFNDAAMAPRKASDAWRAHTEEVRRASDGYEDYQAVANDSLAAIKGLYTGIEYASLKTTILTRDQYEQQRSIERLNASLAGTGDKFAGVTRAMDDDTDVAKRNKTAIDANQAAMAKLSLTIGGPLRRETEDFTNKQADLARQSDELRGKIAGLESSRWLTAAQRADLDEYKAKLGELDLAVAANAQAHDNASKRILFDLLSQRAAANDLTGDELAGLTQIALQWGLVDQQTATAVTSMDAALGTLATSGNIDAFIAGIGGIEAAANAAAAAIAGMGMSGSDMPSGYRQPIPQAAGGDWMVNRPTLFLAGEAGPERATFTPQRGGAQAASGNSNYHNTSNVTIQVTDTLAAAYIVDQARRGRLAQMAASMGA
jgi:hypothetical protein